MARRTRCDEINDYGCSGELCPAYIRPPSRDVSKQGQVRVIGILICSGCGAVYTEPMRAVYTGTTKYKLRLVLRKGQREPGGEIEIKDDEGDPDV